MQLKRSDEIAVPKRVASYLRTRIEAGELRPGDRLLPERKLADQLNVSRTAVREALADLHRLRTFAQEIQNAFSDRDDERAAAILTNHIGRALAFTRRRLQEELGAAPHGRGEASP
jgi:DNA-binding FadR family transcriptional regulator